MVNKIVADEALLGELRGLTGPARLCDAESTPVAVVIPTEMYKGLLSSWSGVRYQPQSAEWAWQDYLQHGGQSTAEVVAMLKALENH